MRIATDLDDVLLEFFPSFLNFYNKKYNKRFIIKNLTSYNIWECGIGKNKEESIRLIDEFYESDDFSLIPFVNGAEEGLNELLRSNTQISIITSRPLRFREKTLASLGRYLSKTGIEVFHSQGLEEKKETKADICKRLNVDFIIEDSPEHALSCCSRGIQTLLFDKPWNRSLNGELERVYNWKEILEKINRGGR